MAPGGDGDEEGLQGVSRQRGGSWLGRGLAGGGERGRKGQRGRQGPSEGMVANKGGAFASSEISARQKSSAQVFWQGHSIHRWCFVLVCRQLHGAPAREAEVVGSARLCSSCAVPTHRTAPSSDALPSSRPLSYPLPASAPVPRPTSMQLRPTPPRPLRPRRPHGQSHRKAQLLLPPLHSLAEGDGGTAPPFSGSPPPAAVPLSCRRRLHTPATPQRTPGAAVPHLRGKARQ